MIETQHFLVLFDRLPESKEGNEALFSTFTNPKTNALRMPRYSTMRATFCVALLLFVAT